MKKRLWATLLTTIVVIGLLPMSALAADDTHTEAAQCLYELGLFQGVGTNADGTPDFALDRAPTRAEAVTMLVRLLGKEAEAKTGTWEMPFTDVADWAKPYVGYAYTNNLTTGTSATTFSGDLTVNATQYLTMVLRALGYNDKWEDDFQWDAAWGKADRVGLTHGEYSADTTSFTRGDVAAISKSALTTQKPWSDPDALLDNLRDAGVVTQKQIRMSRLATDEPTRTLKYIKMDGKAYEFSSYNVGANKQQMYLPLNVSIGNRTENLYLWRYTFMPDFMALICLLSGKYEIWSADKFAAERGAALSEFLDGEIHLDNTYFSDGIKPFKKVFQQKSVMPDDRDYYDMPIATYDSFIEQAGLKLYNDGLVSVYDFLDYLEITDPVIWEKLYNMRVEEIDGNTFLVMD